MPKLELGPVRPVSPVDVNVMRQPGSHNNPAAALSAPEATVVKSDALDPGEAPIDPERISQIRKAVEEGSYPLVPTKIADAMIAAGILLRGGK